MGSNISILVADDVASNRLLLRRVLEHEGLKVVEADGGKTALEVVQAKQCDIALLDVMMPDLDGFSTCREIRKDHSATDLPILFITAKVLDSDLAEGFSAGGNDYISKPINRTVLLARLQAQIQLLFATRALKASMEKIAEQKRMETVGLFASGIAHNFNNLLGTVLGSTELIQLYAKDDPRILKAAGLAQKAARRGAELTDSLLTFNRRTAKPLSAKPADIIAAAIAALPMMRNPNVRVELSVPDPFPEVAIAPLDLSQVLIEILKNSLEAVQGQGQITVGVSLRPTPGSATDKAVFRLTDSGGGIDPGKLEHIFEPFHSTKNLDPMIGISLDGSGLGLSVAYNLITQAGGEIGVAQTGPDGTTIEFSLPIVSETATAASDSR